ncbi:hypothetical protein U1Q18_033699 [Sarracenia purpurea var. burkii]
MEIHMLVKMVFSAALLGVLGLILSLYRTVVAEPERLRSKMRKQGISGPPPTFLFGNNGEIYATARSAKAVAPTSNPTVVVHNCATAIFPNFKKWTDLYGIDPEIDTHAECIHRSNIYVFEGKHTNTAREPTGLIEGDNHMYILGLGEAFLPAERARFFARSGNYHVQRHRLGSSEKNHRPPIIHGEG